MTIATSMYAASRFPNNSWLAFPLKFSLDSVVAGLQPLPRTIQPVHDPHVLRIGILGM